ncbi:MAG TPA: hypothetical protein ENG66_07210 [Thermococcus sp.]|nr:hypothetical protein [Thermococcus sp.]
MLGTQARKRGYQINRVQLKLKRHRALTPDIVAYVMGTRCVLGWDCESCPKYPHCKKRVQRDLFYQRKIEDEVLDYLDRARKSRGPDLCDLGVVSDITQEEYLYEWEEDFEGINYHSSLQ